MDSTLYQIALGLVLIVIDPSLISSMGGQKAVNFRIRLYVMSLPAVFLFSPKVKYPLSINLSIVQIYNL